VLYDRPSCKWCNKAQSSLPPGKYGSVEQLSSQTSSFELAEGIEEIPHGPLFVHHVPFDYLCRLVGTYALRAPVLTSTLPLCDSVGEYAAKEGFIALQGLFANIGESKSSDTHKGS